METVAELRAFCESEIARARNPFAGRTVMRNTRLRLAPTGMFAIRFHETDVLRLRTDDSIMLRTDGWFTVSTRDRINSFSPWRVDWKLARIKDRDDSQDFVFLPDGVAPFNEGVHISHDGEILFGSTFTPAQYREQCAEEERRAKDLTKYMRAAVDGRLAAREGNPELLIDALLSVGIDARVAPTFAKTKTRRPEVRHLLIEAMRQCYQPDRFDLALA